MAQVLIGDGVEGFLPVRGSTSQLLQVLDWALEAADALADKETLASFVHNKGIVFQNQGYYERARQHFEHSLKLNREHDHAAGIASSLHNLGMLAHLQAMFDEAERYYRESLVIA